MPSRQEVALEPALAHVLAQYLHDAAVDAQIDVDRVDFGHPGLAGDFVDGLEPVRGGLVRAEEAKVLLVEIQLHHVADKLPQHPRRLRLDSPRLGHRHGVVVEVGHRQRLQQLSSIGVRVAAHAVVARRRELGELLAELALAVEQLLWPIALEPVLELRQVLGILEIGDRNLMRAPRSLDRLAVDEFRSRPTLRCPEHDHRPAWPLRPFRAAERPRGDLDPANLCQDDIERSGETLVHQCRIVAFDEVRLVAVAVQQLGQFLAADAGQHRRIGDLEAVEVKDRQHRAVARGIEEFVGVPAGGQRGRLRLAVADDAANNQIGIVEGRPIRVDQRIAQFSAFMNGAGSLGRYVTRNPVWP